MVGDIHELTFDDISVPKIFQIRNQILVFNDIDHNRRTIAFDTLSPVR